MVRESIMAGRYRIRGMPDIHLETAVLYGQYRGFGV